MVNYRGACRAPPVAIFRAPGAQYPLSTMKWSPTSPPVWFAISADLAVIRAGRLLLQVVEEAVIEVDAALVVHGGDLVLAGQPGGPKPARCLGRCARTWSPRRTARRGVRPQVRAPVHRPGAGQVGGELASRGIGTADCAAVNCTTAAVLRSVIPIRRSIPFHAGPRGTMSRAPRRFLCPRRFPCGALSTERIDLPPSAASSGRM
jgi:hypothetical protein